MVWNLYNKNERKQAAATWTTACDCAVAFQPDSCGGSEPLSWLWCRDTFAPLHLCHESVVCRGLLLTSPPLLSIPLRSLTPSNPLFFFCLLSPWQQTKRRLYVSVILAARHSRSADTRCNPHLTVYKVLGHRTCQSIYLLLHIIGSIIEAHFERLMFCFSVPRDPSTTLGPSGRGSGN